MMENIYLLTKALSLRNASVFAYLLSMAEKPRLGYINHKRVKMNFLSHQQGISL